MIPDQVERCALLGWHVYPAAPPPSRAACVRDPSRSASRDLDQIEEWAERWPHCGWRAVAGPSGWIALDVDAATSHAADGMAAMRRLVAEHGALPSGPRLRTGGSGCVVFFAAPEQPIRGESGKPWPGIDPRRGWQSVTLPPSLHWRTRRPYQWYPGRAPWEVALPAPPSWLLEALKPPPAPHYVSPVAVTEGAAWVRLVRAANRVASAGQGERNGTLNRASYGLGMLVRAGKLGERDVEGALCEAAVRAGLPYAEARATVRSGLRGALR